MWEVCYVGEGIARPELNINMTSRCGEVEKRGLSEAVEVLVVGFRHLS